MRAGRERRSLRLLALVPLGITAGVVLESFYFVRELLLFVALAALLVFFAANLAVIGILVHAAGQSIFRSVRKVNMCGSKSPSNNAFSMAIGGGVDIAVSPKFAIRLVDADMTSPASATTSPAAITVRATFVSRPVCSFDFSNDRAWV